MLLNTYEHHHTEAFHILTTFASVFRPRSIYAATMSSIFHFLFHFQRHLFFCLFSRMFLEILDDNVNEECGYFSNRKSSASGCCLAFA